MLAGAIGAHWPYRVVTLSSGPTVIGESVIGHRVIAVYCPYCVHDGLSEVTAHGDQSPSYICKRCRSHFKAPTQAELA